MGAQGGTAWPRWDVLGAKAAKGCYFQPKVVQCSRHVVEMTKPWPETVAITEKAENQAEEAKCLKLISFPEMDSDGLPSCYAMKVAACLGKWQLKMHDLGNMMDPKNATMKPFPGFIL